MEYFFTTFQLKGNMNHNNLLFIWIKYIHLNKKITFLQIIKTINRVRKTFI